MVWQVGRMRLLLRTPCPVQFGTCKCSTCWDHSFPRICSYFPELCNSDIPRYFLDYAFWWRLCVGFHYLMVWGLLSQNRATLFFLSIILEYFLGVRAFVIGLSKISSFLSIYYHIPQYFISSKFHQNPANSSEEEVENVTDEWQTEYLTRAFDLGKLKTVVHLIGLI